MLNMAKTVSILILEVHLVIIPSYIDIALRLLIVKGKIKFIRGIVLDLMGLGLGRLEVKLVETSPFPFLATVLLRVYLVLVEILLDEVTMG